MKGLLTLANGEIGSIGDARSATEILRIENVRGIIKVHHANVALIVPPHLVARPLPSTLKTGDCFRIASQPFIVKDSYPWGVTAVSPEGVQVPFDVAELASATVLI